MGSLEIVERYLRAHLAQLTAVGDVPARNDAHAFVTISRQAGAGGHSLAERLVTRFEEEPEEVFQGWAVYDQRLCEIVAEDPKMKSALDSLLAEEYRTPAGDFFRQVIAPTVDQDVVMARVFEVVRAVASTGKSIIVGRGGSQVTRDIPHGVHLRLVAPESVRLERLAERDGIDVKTARERARKLDAGRARLHKLRFGVDIDDPLGYDAVWNTAAADIDEIADAVLALVRDRARTPRTV